MNNEKIIITTQMREYITQMRKKHGITAYRLSELCDRNKTWIPNIENKKTTTMTKKDASTLANVFISLEENAEFEAYVEKQVELMEDPSYQEYLDSEYEKAHYSYINQKKDVRHKLTLMENNIRKLSDKCDYSSKESVEKYQPYINTLVGLITSDNGKRIFTKLFKYPLHFLDEATIEKMQNLIEKELYVHYEVQKDENSSEYYLKVSTPEEDDDDLFS